MVLTDEKINISLKLTAWLSVMSLFVFFYAFVKDNTMNALLAIFLVIFALSVNIVVRLRVLYAKLYEEQNRSSSDRSSPNQSSTTEEEP